MGERLTADVSGITDADGLNNVSYGYQWLADGADIKRETDLTYDVSDGDVWKTIKVQVSFIDGRNNSETLTSAATMVVVAIPPVVAGPSSLDYPENGTSTVATYSSYGTGAGAITWTLSGIDANVFAITAGDIEFRTPPNYESPADHDEDNEYRVEVMVTDSAGTTGTKAVAIKVTDVWDPNVVLFLGDDVGYEAFGAYGSTQYRTPRLDEIAEAGVRFTNAYSKPGCTPSRVALMTGKSNVRNYADWSVLLPGGYTIADLFREAGYATAIAGKWQLDGGESMIPGVGAGDSGFDTYCLWNTLQTDRSRYWDPSIECDGQVINRTSGRLWARCLHGFSAGVCGVQPGRPVLRLLPDGTASLSARATTKRPMSHR